MVGKRREKARQRRAFKKQQESTGTSTKTHQLLWGSRRDEGKRVAVIAPRKFHQENTWIVMDRVRKDKEGGNCRLGDGRWKVEGIGCEKPCRTIPCHVTICLSFDFDFLDLFTFHAHRLIDSLCTIVEMSALSHGH